MIEDEKNILKPIVKDPDGYKEGAIGGALVGVVLAAMLRKNIMYGGLIGLIGGGYIGYLVNKPDNSMENKFNRQ